MNGSSMSHFGFSQSFQRIVYSALVRYGFAMSLAIPNGMTDRYDVQDALAEIDSKG